MQTREKRAKSEEVMHTRTQRHEKPAATKPEGRKFAGKPKNIARKALGVGAKRKASGKVADVKDLRDDYFLARENDIGEKFAKLVDERVAAAENGKEKRTAVETIYYEVANKFAERRGWLNQALMWLRKPAGMALRIGLGVGLGAVAFATGGWAAAVLGLTIYGVASRYLLVDGMWDKIHHLYTGRTKKKEYGMAAQLFYNNAKKHLFSLTADIAVLEKKLKRKRIVESLDAGTTRRINAMKEGENINLLFGKRAYCIERKGDKFSMYANNIGTLGEKIYADSGKISGEKLDEASRRYAHNLARNRFWKKLLAVAYVALPPVISGSVANLFVSQKVVYAVESATQAAKTVVEQPPAQDIYTVPKGGGIWHICKAIAHDKIPSFDNLSVADQNIAIDSMKDAVVANPAKYGLEPSEIIPRALEKGGPWLRLGADMHAKDLASAVPKRLMDTLGLGSHSITSASIKAAVKGATSHGDISKAVAIGHSIKR